MLPPFLDGYDVQGYTTIKKSYQVIAVTKLSPTAVLFSTAELGQVRRRCPGIKKL